MCQPGSSPLPAHRTLPCRDLDSHLTACEETLPTLKWSACMPRTLAAMAPWFLCLLISWSALMPAGAGAQLPSDSSPRVLSVAAGYQSVFPESLAPPPWEGNGIRHTALVGDRITVHLTQAAANSPRPKSPFLAWFLSWLVPGGGQGYNGQWGKAAAFFGGAAVGFALVTSNDGWACGGDCGARDTGFAILLVSGLGAQIDAPISAARINRKAREAVAPEVTLTVGSIRF